MKKMLFVNGNYNDVPLVKEAHNLGYYVITSGNDPKGEAHQLADRYCPCDYSNKEEMLKLASSLDIDAICSCGNDFGATTAAYVAEKLRLPGHDTYAVSRIFHEKDEFKRIVQEYNLPSPKSEDFSDIGVALDYLKHVSFPQIIKPVDLGGGKGISVANNIAEAEKAVRVAFEKSKIKHIVIEDYIEGTQHAFICYIKDKNVVFDYSSNDYSYINPYMVWVATGYPADNYDSVRSRIIADVEKLAHELNMCDGILTIQYIMRDGKPYYLETMRRCLGNMHFKAISKDCGVNIYKLFVSTEAGLDCSELIKSFRPTGFKSGFMGIYADKNGVFNGVEFDDRFKEHIYDMMMLHDKGYVVDDYLNDKLGMVWYSFTKEEDRQKFIKNKKTYFKVDIK